jgi:type I restriction enzyme S subunit
MSLKMKLGRSWGQLGMKSEWNIGTISEVCSLVTDGSHYSPKSCDNGEYMVSVKDFKGFGFDFSNCKHISSSDYEKMKASGCIPECGDILIGKDGARFFEDIIIYNQPEKPALLSSIAILRCNPDIILPQFLYYICKNPVFKKDVRDNYGSGSAIPRIVLKDFKRMPISYPDLDEQRKIVASLVAIDDRILLNTAINENLESQAQAFFTDLFITNAKPEWKTGTVSDLGDVVGGGTPSKKVEEYYTNDGIAWITPKDLSNDKSKFITHGETDITDLGLAKSSATLMPRGSVLFSSRAPIGYIAIADGQVSTNQGFKSIVPFDNVGTAYVYYFLKENLSAIENVASGSTFKEVSGGTMKNFPAIIPDADTLAKFKQFCSPLLEQQRALEYENRYLASLRDALLPKLMNGEIDVSEVKI